MPKDKSGNIVCVNECAPMIDILSKGSGATGHALFQIEEQMADGKAVFNLNKGFIVHLYACPECGYVEMYDDEPHRLRE